MMWQHCYLRKKKSIIFVANTRAPFRSIIQHYIVSMIFCLCCCYCCHSETSLSFSILFSLFLCSLLVAQFFSINLSLYIYNRLSSNVFVRKFFFFLSRVIYLLCTYTRAIALFSLFCPGLVRVCRWRMPFLYRYPTSLVIYQFVFMRCWISDGRLTSIS